MDTSNQDNFDPSSIGAKPYSADAFDPSSIGAKPYTPNTSPDEVNNAAGVLGVANNHNSVMRDASGAATTEQMSSFQQDDQQAKQNADQANSPAGIATETAKTTADTLINPAAKFIKSAVTSPLNIVRSLFGYGPIDTTGGAKDYHGNPVTTIQEDAAANTGKVFEGQMSPLSAGIQAVGDTVGGAGDVLGAGEGVSGGLKLAAKGVDALAGTTAGKAVVEALSNRATQKATQEALNVVTPKLTTKETEAALAQGRGQGGGLFSKTTIAPDARLNQIADATKGLVNKSASGAENINNVRNALNTEADNLKNQIKAVDHPYSFRELQSQMNNIQSPISIKGTAFEKQIGAVKNAAMDISKKNGGNVSSLLDSRKEFDALVSKEYPNLYDKENAPMRNAITGIRNTMNDFIEKNLPNNVEFKNSLKKQSLMYDAIDNIAGKSVSETKSTGLQRLGSAVKKHPVGAIVTGAATGEGIRKITTGSF